MQSREIGSNDESHFRASSNRPVLPSVLHSVSSASHAPPCADQKVSCSFLRFSVDDHMRLF